MEPFKTEVKTGYLKTEQNVKNKQDYRGGGVSRKSFSQENQVKKDHNEYIEKNSSKHSRNWARHKILPLLTIPIKSSRT